MIQGRRLIVCADKEICEVPCVGPIQKRLALPGSTCVQAARVRYPALVASHGRVGAAPAMLVRRRSHVARNVNTVHAAPRAALACVVGQGALAPELRQGLAEHGTAHVPERIRAASLGMRRVLVRAIFPSRGLVALERPTCAFGRDKPLKVLPTASAEVNAGARSVERDAMTGCVPADRHAGGTRRLYGCGRRPTPAGRSRHGAGAGRNRSGCGRLSGARAGVSCCRGNGGAHKARHAALTSLRPVGWAKLGVPDKVPYEAHLVTGASPGSIVSERGARR